MDLSSVHRPYASTRCLPKLVSPVAVGIVRCCLGRCQQLPCALVLHRAEAQAGSVESKRTTAAAAIDDFLRSFVACFACAARSCVVLRTPFEPCTTHAASLTTNTLLAVTCPSLSPAPTLRCQRTICGCARARAARWCERSTKTAMARYAILLWFANFSFCQNRFQARDSPAVLVHRQMMQMQTFCWPPALWTACSGRHLLCTCNTECTSLADFTRRVRQHLD